jgi:hypothetical protein
MPIGIMLQGDFDYEALYEGLEDKKLFEHVSSFEPQRYSFHLKDVPGIFIQVYPTGKVRIDTDDFCDPYDLVRIIHEAAWIASRHNPCFKVLSIAPLRSISCYIGRKLVLARMGFHNPDGLDEALALADEEAYRMKRVFKAIRDFQEEDA